MTELFASTLISSHSIKPFYFLFDVDDTLTKPKTEIDESTCLLIKRLSKYAKISLVGGGTYNHITDQTFKIKKDIEYIFSENGTVVYKNDELVKKESINKEIGEENIKLIINFILFKLSTISIPFKRGTFIEFRNGLINISPVGKNCTLEERELFHIYDNNHHVLKYLKEEIELFLINNKLDNILSVSFGGKISVDIYPHEWSKSYCLMHLPYEKENIVFLGDKIFEGGNDYSIAVDSRVFGYIKVNPQKKINKILEEILTIYE